MESPVGNYWIAPTLKNHHQGTDEDSSLSSAKVKFCTIPTTYPILSIIDKEL
jgi:hypothetical protein